MKENNYIAKMQVQYSIRMIFGFILLLPLMAIAQPELPGFSLSTRTYYELDIQSIAILDIEPSANTTLSLSVPIPNEAGEGPSSITPLSTDNSLFLNYSSALLNISSRKIQAAMVVTSGTLPAGLELRLTASTPSSGAGVLGSSEGPQTLGVTPVDIITGIGGGYTASGSSVGSQLQYDLIYTGSDFNTLRATSSLNLQITFTFIDVP